VSKIPLFTYTCEKAWDTIWKWKWFEKEMWEQDFRKVREGTRRALASLLSELGVKTILDCSCGLGWKTILLAEMGYEPEGSDGSAVAVKYASQLVKEEGVNIGFFQSRWKDLEKNSRQKYDCVYNDSFAWCQTIDALRDSAKGIYSVLNKGGKFVFLVEGAHQWSKESDRGRIMEEAWKRERRFEILPFYEKEGIKLLVLISREKITYGIRGNRIHIIEENGMKRIEIASVIDLFKWSWSDYVKTLTTAGFREVYSVKVEDEDDGVIFFNVGVK